MTAYTYNEENGVYTGPYEAQKDPICSEKEGKDVFLLPGAASWDSPPDFDPETQRAIWTGGDWKVEDIPIAPNQSQEPEPESTYTADDLFSALLGTGSTK